MKDKYLLHYIEEAIENFYAIEMQLYPGLQDLFKMLKEAEDIEEYSDILIDIDNLLCDIEYKEIEDATNDS